MNYRFLNNAFWENNEKTQLKCIRVETLSDGKERSKVLSLSKFRPDGSPDALFKEVIDTLTIPEIDRTTAERVTRKKKEAAEAQIIRDQEKKSHEMENLFALKLRAFEVEEIKNTTNRKLRSKLRRASNEIELNAIATLIIGEELGYFKSEE